MSNNLFQFYWHSVNNLILVIPIILLIIFFVLKKYKWRRLVVCQLGANNLLNFSLMQKKIQACLVITALIALAAAMARPQSDLKQENIKQEGRNVLIALDISRSMAAQDLTPSRLEAAKEKIKQLANALQTDSLGLIVFSSTAHIYIPFTNDTEAFLNFLSTVSVEQFSHATTAFDKAIEKAIEVFDANNLQKDKILILFTDGEDFSQNLDATSDKASKLGIKIFTIGIGSQHGAPIPNFDHEGKIIGYQEDKNGKIVISALNAKLLQTLSNKLSAFYVQATEDGSDTNKIINVINKLEKEKHGDKKITLMQERFYYFAFLSLVLLLIDWLI